jgi:RNA ligase (TIGR02306 family)
MIERKLASIRKIKELLPIEGADAIEVAVVDGWKVVTKKGEFKPGDLCVYFEIDSFLPIEEDFEFLRKSSYKKMGDLEGFRLKTIKLKGQVSQGLCLPLSILENDSDMKIGISQQPWGDQLQLGPWDDAILIEEGTDVTDYLHVLKYEPPIPAELSGKVKGGFPSFLRKTDEERVQNLEEQFLKLNYRSDHKFYVTEKLDGSSATFYFRNGQFGVCSRNLELLETPDNTFWKVARELQIEEKLGSLGINICLQGELIGEGIQGNPYKIKGHTVKFFNAFDIDNHKKLVMREFVELIEKLEFDYVPFLALDFLLPHTVDGMLQWAEGKSGLNPNTEREGVVIRSYDMSISFKAISNKFLLKNDK